MTRSSMDREQTKALVREIILEMLEDPQSELFQWLMEVLEDLALGRLIEKGQEGGHVHRGQLRALLAPGRLPSKKYKSLDEGLIVIESYLRDPDVVQVSFKESFHRDLKHLRDKSLKAKIMRLIEEVERVSSLSDLPHVTKLRGYANYYRIRMGDYRLGLVIEGNTVTFVRFLHRRDIYRYFP